MQNTVLILNGLYLLNLSTLMSILIENYVCIIVKKLKNYDHQDVQMCLHIRLDETIIEIDHSTKKYQATF